MPDAKSRFSKSKFNIMQLGLWISSRRKKFVTFYRGMDACLVERDTAGQKLAYVYLSRVGDQRAGRRRSGCRNY
jgi:hypothetical protein